MVYLLVIFTLGLAVLAHELGHFVVARLCGFRVRQLVIGFGPRLWRFRRRGTEYAIGALPLGASAKIVGIGTQRSLEPEEEGGSGRLLTPGRRAAVHASGPVANVILSWAVLLSLYLSGTHVPVARTLGAVVPASEAARALLRPGDEIIEVEGATVLNWSDLVKAISKRTGRPTRLTFLRSGKRMEATVTPQSSEDGAGRIGVGQQYLYRRHNFGEAATLSLRHLPAVAMEGLTWATQLLTGKPGPELAQRLARIRQASQTTANGKDAFLRTLAAASLLLAAFQLLPLPSLDGGRLLFAGLEAVGKPVSPRVELAFHTLGFILLTALLLWFVASELMQFIQTQQGFSR